MTIDGSFAKCHDCKMFVGIILAIKTFIAFFKVRKNVNIYILKSIPIILSTLILFASMFFMC